MASQCVRTDLQGWAHRVNEVVGSGTLSRKRAWATALVEAVADQRPEGRRQSTDSSASSATIDSRRNRSRLRSVRTETPGMPRARCRCASRSARRLSAHHCTYQCELLADRLRSRCILPKVIQSPRDGAKLLPDSPCQGRRSCPVMRIWSEDDAESYRCETMIG